MSVNIRDYVSDDHIESIGEIAKSQSSIIQALSLDNSKLERENEQLKSQLQQKENIIKEVRECINKNRVYIAGERNLAFEIEQILDKGE